MNVRSLTFRLVAWYCGLLLLVGSFFSVYVYVRFTSYIHNTVRHTLATRVNDIASLTGPLLSNPSLLGAAIERRFAPEAHDRLIRITVDGQTVYTSLPPIDKSFIPDAIHVEPTADGHLLNVGDLWLYSRNDDLHGHTVSIESGQSAVAMINASRSLADTLIIALPILLGIAALGGHQLVKRALMPVGGMINAAEILTLNSPHKRLPLAGTHDVLDELGQTLNRMLERMDHVYQYAKRFSADAAHELRTPLAIVRGELEFVALQVDLSPEAQDAIGGALDETVRLGEIVENLIALASIQGIGRTRAHEAVDLRVLSIETIGQMRLLAEEKEIELTCIHGPPVMTLGDRDQLKRVVVNLIDNAIKYTHVGGRIVIDVLQTEKYASVEISDTGIGIAPEHQDHIFERFFRVDPDRGVKGAGLGLAIIKSICADHGGFITVESALGRGSTFRVRLPLAHHFPVVGETA